MLKYLHSLRRLALSFGLAVLGTAAVGQGAPLALSTFSDVCLTDTEHSRTVAAFSQAGWSASPSELEQLFAQDLVDPDETSRFVMNLDGGGSVLAAALSEKRGLLGTRNKTVCMLRLFVETPERIRADFRDQQAAQPDDVTNSAEVAADIWDSYSNGKVIGFRATLLPEGFWMVTLTRVLVDG